MDISGLQKNWDDLGRKDSLYAILTDNKKTDESWDEDVFFKTGDEEITVLLGDINGLGYNLDKKFVLDFGCGVGRLSQALSLYFDNVIGVDIAPSMIEQANKFNRHGPKCKYILNSTNDLKIFKDDTFNLIYTNIVLQHMNPVYAKNYIREFIRITKNNGLIVFQLPERPKSYIKYYLIKMYRKFKSAIYKMIKISDPMLLVEMNYIKLDEIKAIVNSNNCKLIYIKSNNNSGNDFISYTYFVVKN